MVAARVRTPQAAKVYRLKRELGLYLKHGWVREEDKEKLRYAAKTWPELFGLWANI
jgi:hypothetical protein